MGWLIALGVLAFLAILPVGIRVLYNEDGLSLSFLFSFLKFNIYPKPEKEEKKTEKKEPAKKAGGTKASAKEKKGGKLADLKPILEIVWDFLGGLRRKVRVKRLDLNLVMASDDPCDLALNYGKTWAAVGNLMPLLEKYFIIKKKNVQVQCDFTADTSRVTARLDATITVGRTIVLAVKHGIPAIREILKLKNTNKGGSVK